MCSGTLGSSVVSFVYTTLFNPIVQLTIKYAIGKALFFLFLFINIIPFFKMIFKKSREKKAFRMTLWNLKI